MTMTREVGEGVGLFEVVRGEENGFPCADRKRICPQEAAAGFDLSIPTVGSSRKIRSGLPQIARAKRRRCLLAAAELAEEAVFNALKLGDA